MWMFPSPPVLTAMTSRRMLGLLLLLTSYTHHMLASAQSELITLITNTCQPLYTSSSSSSQPESIGSVCPSLIGDNLEMDITLNTPDTSALWEIHICNLPYVTPPNLNLPAYTLQIPLEDVQNFVCSYEETTYILAGHATVSSLSQQQAEPLMNQAYFELELGCPIQIASDPDYSDQNSPAIHPSCRSAFAYLNPNANTQCQAPTEYNLQGYCANCFQHFSFDGSYPAFFTWGWTNGALYEGLYNLELWTGATHCDLSNGQLVGSVSVEYNNAQEVLKVGFDMTSLGEQEYSLYDTHVYVDTQILPTNPHGQDPPFSIFPGEYPSIHQGLNHAAYDEFQLDVHTLSNPSGETTTAPPPIYIIAHAVVCPTILDTCPSPKQGNLCDAEIYPLVPTTCMETCHYDSLCLAESADFYKKECSLDCPISVYKGECETAKLGPVDCGGCNYNTHCQATRVGMRVQTQCIPFCPAPPESYSNEVENAKCEDPTPITCDDGPESDYACEYDTVCEAQAAFAYAGLDLQMALESGFCVAEGLGVVMQAFADAEEVSTEVPLGVVGEGQEERHSMEVHFCPPVPQDTTTTTTTTTEQQEEQKEEQEQLVECKEADIAVGKVQCGSSTKVCQYNNLCEAKRAFAAFGLDAEKYFANGYCQAEEGSWVPLYSMVEPQDGQTEVQAEVQAEAQPEWSVPQGCPPEMTIQEEEEEECDMPFVVKCAFPNTNPPSSELPQTCEYPSVCQARASFEAFHFDFNAAIEAGTCTVEGMNYIQEMLIKAAEEGMMMMAPTTTTTVAPEEGRVRRRRGRRLRLGEGVEV